MILAVIDTNVLVSGLLSPTGNEALIVLAIRQGLVRPCFTEEMLTEYAEVLARPKFAFQPGEVAEVMAMMRVAGEPIPPGGGAAFALPDPDDSEFVRCAVAAAAEYIVTGNKRHFPEASYGGARVVSAGELLERLTFEL